MSKFAKNEEKSKNFFCFSFYSAKKVVTSLIVSNSKQNCKTKSYSNGNWQKNS